MLSKHVRRRKMVQTTQNGASAPPVVHNALLDITKVPKLVGTEPARKARHLLKVVENTTIPLYLIGPSGSGKTATMKAVGKVYSHTHKVPCYYVQLSPEDTKTSIFLGHRIIRGSLEVVEGVMAIAAQQKAIVLVDEITHSTHQMLLMFNSLDGGDSVITIGDRAINADGMRVIYGSNASTHAGNIRVPQSFANRVISFAFEYPEFEDELVIAKDIARRNWLGSTPLDVPDAVITFLTSFVREKRRPDWPLSARNIAHGILLAQLAEIKHPEMSAKANKIADYFTKNQNIAASRQNIATRLQIVAKDATALQRPEIGEFLEFVSKTGVEEFKQLVLSAVNFHVDMEGMDVFDTSLRQDVLSTII